MQKILVKNIRESFTGTRHHPRLKLQQGNVKAEAKPTSAECFHEKTREYNFANLKIILCIHKLPKSMKRQQCKSAPFQVRLRRQPQAMEDFCPFPLLRDALQQLTVHLHPSTSKTKAFRDFSCFFICRIQILISKKKPQKPHSVSQALNYLPVLTGPLLVCL